MILLAAGKKTWTWRRTPKKNTNNMIYCKIKTIGLLDPNLRGQQFICLCCVFFPCFSSSHHPWPSSKTIFWWFSTRQTSSPAWKHEKDIRKGGVSLSWKISHWWSEPTTIISGRMVPTVTVFRTQSLLFFRFHVSRLLLMWKASSRPCQLQHKLSGRDLTLT